jgi:hypothetical protein
MAKIVNAAIRINGNLYTGASHKEAINKAKKDGKSVANVNRLRDGKFITSDKRIISRDTAKKKFGVSHSSEVPNLRKRSKI